MADALSPENLTGIWQGTYSYPEHADAVPFTVSLLDSGGTLTGTTHEVGAVPPARGLPLYGAILGSRAGRTASFLKTYHQEFVGTGYSATIFYDGAISDDGTEIEGRWRIPNAWEGKFLMIRQGRTTQAEARKAVANV